MKQTIFGIHAVQRLLEQSPDSVKILWLQEGRKDKKIERIVDLASKYKLSVKFVSSKWLSEQIDGRHQGIVAELNTKLKRYSENDLGDILADANNPLALVLDGVEDPHNLGACLRSADAAGVSVVIAPKDNAVGLTSTACKVACGAAESVPFVQVTNLARTLRWLQDQGFWLYGLAGEAEQSVYQAEFSSSVAIVMGAEGTGLRRLTREICDFLVKIPMQGTVESLNVSVATGISLFEVRRQQSI